MDYRNSSIKGRTTDQLRTCLNALGLDEYGDNKKVNAWSFDSDKGLCFYSYPTNKSQELPVSMYFSELTDMIVRWLQTEEAKSFKVIHPFDTEMDHDGHNERGWRLTCNNDDMETALMVTPAWCAYGK